MKNFISALLISLTLSLPVLAFSDTNSSPYKTAIDYVAEAEIVSGYEDGTYKPNQRINRAEFTKIIAEATNLTSYVYADNCFDDVERNSWYEVYVCAANLRGYIGGYPDGSFKPGQNVNLAEALKITLNTYEYDIAEGSVWYQGYLDFAQTNSLLNGFANGDPSREISRAEMAQLIYNLDSFRNYVPVRDVEFSGETIEATGTFFNVPTRGSALYFVTDHEDLQVNDGFIGIANYPTPLFDYELYGELGIDWDEVGDCAGIYGEATLKLGDIEKDDQSGFAVVAEVVSSEPYTCGLYELAETLKTQDLDELYNQ